MTRPLVVLMSIAVIANSVVLPSIVFRNGNGSTGSFNGNLAFVPAAIVLLLCLLTWRWRGALWLILSVLGIAAAFAAPMAIYNVMGQIVAQLGPSLKPGPPSYSVGLYINLVGYAVIIGASIRDMILKQRAVRAQAAPAQ